MTSSLYRLSEVQKIIGFQKSHIYKLIAIGAFPCPIKVRRSSRWLSEEIYRWIDVHASQRSQENSKTEISNYSNFSKDASDKKSEVKK